MQQDTKQVLTLVPITLDFMKLDILQVLLRVK